MEQWILSREATDRLNVYYFFPFLWLIPIQPVAVILEGTDAKVWTNY